MCLFPKLILNKKYLPTRKNNYNPPQLTDERLRYVPVGCGNCVECRQQKARAWQVRLNEELKVNNYSYFVTLTFDCEQLAKLCKDSGLKESNAVAGLAVRRFLERYRKKYKKSVKHWLITELGHENTERIHLHGIIFRDIPLFNEELQELWKYGITDIGKYCNSRTINYIVKYVTKIDIDHKTFHAQIFCSAGLGKNYITSTRNQFKGKDTKETYIAPNGSRINLPIYYRNHFYTDEQREYLWQQKLDKSTIFVRGIPCKVDSDRNIKLYNNILRKQQEINYSLGYGDDSKEWQKEPYNVTLRMLNKNRAVREKFLKK